MEIVITLGSNIRQTENILKAKEILRERFPDIRFTDEEWTEPVGVESDKYLNCIGRFSTTLKAKELRCFFKKVESDMGDTHENHQRGCVHIDIDLIQYGNTKLKDIIWRTIIGILLCLSCLQPTAAQATKSDAVELDKALEYFTSGKYHEALLIFRKLDEKYKLNDRFRAYIALCYYHDWDYPNAAKTFDATLPRLQTLAPRERSVYAFAAAESHFLMQQYQQATRYYENALDLCAENEKGEIYYRLGCCAMFQEEWQRAADYFGRAQNHFRCFQQSDNVKARMAQAQRMEQGCRKMIGKAEQPQQNTPGQQSANNGNQSE